MKPSDAYLEFLHRDPAGPRSQLPPTNALLSAVKCSSPDSALPPPHPQGGKGGVRGRGEKEVPDILSPRAWSKAFISILILQA